MICCCCSAPLQDSLAHAGASRAQRLLSPVGLQLVNDQEDLGVAGAPSSVRRLGQRGRRRSRRLFDSVGDGGEEAGSSACRLRLAARRAPLPGPWRHCGALLRRIGSLEVRHVAIGKVRDEIAVGEASTKIVHDGNQAELTDLRMSLRVEATSQLDVQQNRMTRLLFSMCSVA